MKKHHKKYLYGLGMWFFVVKAVLFLWVSLWILQQRGIFADFEDNIPDPVVFESVIDAEVNIGYDSNVVTIAGIDTWTTISIENGWYAINGGEFTSDIGVLNAWDQLMLRWTASSEYSTETIVTILLARDPYTYSITTRAPLEEEVVQQEELSVCEVEIPSILSGATYRATFPITFTITWCEVASGTEYNIHIVDLATNAYVVGTAAVEYSISWYTATLEYDSLTIQTGRAEGYSIQIAGTDVAYTSDPFTIDNQKPTLTGIVLQVNWANAWYIGSGWSVVLSFTADKVLSWTTIVNVLGTNATLTSTSWMTYTYTKELSLENTEWNIAYNIQYQDEVGNTWYTEWFISTIFDKTTPTLTGLVFSGNNTWFTMGFTWWEAIKYTLTYGVSGATSTTMIQQTQFATGHTTTITALNKANTYTFTLSAYDLANNTTQVTGYFYFTTSWDIRYRHSLITESTGTLVSVWFTWTVETTTWATGGLLSLALKNEILKFNECKEDIDFTWTKVNIDGYTATLLMPNFSKSYVKKIVSAFTVVMVQRLQKQSLTDDQLDILVKKFNNFLVVLKLMRDDDNSCKQNLTNYHINQLKQTLKEYNITIE